MTHFIKKLFKNKTSILSFGTFISILVLILISFIFYKYYLNINLYEFITMITTFLISLVIFRKIKFSENILVHFIQTIFIYTLMFIISLTLYLIIILTNLF